jgi:rhamnose transport system permease protein
LSGGAWVNADKMSPAFIALQRGSFLGLPVLAWFAVVIDRLLLHRDDTHGDRALDLRDRRQPDRGGLCRHRCRAHASFFAFCMSGAAGRLVPAISGCRDTSVASMSIVANGFRASDHRGLRDRRHVDRGRHRLASAARCSARCSSAIIKQCAARHKRLSILAARDLGQRSIILAVVLNARGEKRKGRIILRREAA